VSPPCTLAQRRAVAIVCDMTDPDMTHSGPLRVADLDFTPRGDVFRSPLDWRDQVMYQLLIDRFDNNADDLRPYDPATAPRGRDVEHSSRFLGANLRGLIRRLDYIRNLGCTAIWISPPFQQ